VREATLNSEHRAAIERLYREEGDRIWRAVLFWAGDREAASDAVAEAFAQALRRGEAIRDPRAWVWRASFRIAAGELKRRRRFEPLQEASYDDPLPGPMWAVLKRLTTKQRASVVLRYYAGYPLADIARMIDSTPAAVAVHLHRARARIREAIADEESS
jgi:DNA-directed RNA polymerase specialized sigma24 family protein